MKHLTPITRAPKQANIDLNGIFNAKVESKEAVINEKVNVFS